MSERASAGPLRVDEREPGGLLDELDDGGEGFDLALEAAEAVAQSVPDAPGGGGGPPGAGLPGDAGGADGLPDAPMMADREASTPVDDPAGVMGMIQGSTSRDLPGDTADQLGGTLGQDLSHVRIHTDTAAAQAADAIHANAFALGDDVFFGSGQYKPGTAEGDELIAHELTHVAQYDQGRLPSTAGALDVSRPSDAAEGEARDTAAASMLGGAGAGAKGPGGRTTAAPLGAGTAMRDVQAGQDTTQGPTAPSQVTLTLGGVPVQVQMPSGATPGRVAVQVPSPIPGVTLSNVQVDFDASFQVIGGTASASVNAGPYVGQVNGNLSIGAGGAFSGQVGPATLNLSGVGTGTVDLSIGPDGVTGRGSIAGSNVQLVHGLHADSGALDVALAADGTVAYSGSLSGRIDGVGTFQMNAAGTNETLTGSVNATLQPGINVATGITVENGQVQGNYDAAGLRLNGTLGFAVGDWAQGTVAGSYDSATAVWDANGQIDQVGERAFGDTVLHSGTLQVTVTGGQLQPATAMVGVTSHGFEAVVDGTWDLLTDTLNASGQVTLTEDKALAGGAATLTAFTGTATLTDNMLTEITGAATADVLYQGQPTFRVDVADTRLLPQELSLSGQATVTTLRELAIGPESGTHLRIATGAVANGTVADNALQSLDGGLQFTAVDAGGEFGAGTATARLAGPDGPLDAEATFSFTTEYGIPDRASRTAYFRPGGQVVVTVTGGALQAATATALPFSVGNPGGQGRLDGDFTGSLDFQAARFDGQVNSAIAEEWPVAVDFGELAFMQGGTVNATIADSQLTTVDGTLPYRSRIEGTPPLSLEGTLGGVLDVPAGSFTGTGTGTLTEAAPIDLQGGGQLIIQAGSNLTVPVNANVVETLQVDARANLHDAGGADLGQGALNGSFSTTTGLFTGGADVILNQDLPLDSASTGQGDRLESWEIGLASGSSVHADLIDNQLQRSQIDAGAWLDRNGERVAVGQVNGELLLGDDPEGFTGSVSASVIVPIDWHQEGRFHTQVDVGTTFDAQVSQSAITTATGAFKLAVLEGGARKADVLINSSYAPGAGLSGDGTATVTAEILAWEGDGNALAIMPGTSATATVTNDALQNLNGALQLLYRDGEGDLLKGSFNANMNLEGEQSPIDGTGEVSTLRDITLGEGGEYASILENGSTVTATLAQSQLQHLTGAATIRVEQGGNPFLHGALNGTYTHADRNFTGDGSFQVTRDTDLGISAGEYTLWLSEGGTATGSVVGSQLQSLSGNVPLRLDDGEGTLARIELQGAYDHNARSFDGSGQGEVVREKHMGDAGPFAMWLIPGTGATFSVAANQLTEIGGEVKTRADLDGAPFANIDLEGTWTEAAGFNGTGSAEMVVPEYEAAQMGAYSLMIIQGAGAIIEVQNNALTTIAGEVPLAIKKGGADFMTGQLNGTYQFAERSFSGGGSMEVVEEQRLAAFPNGEEFWLNPASGAEVTIAENQLTRVGGNVNLSLRDAEGEYLQVAFDGAANLGGEVPDFTGGGTASVTREKLLFGDRGAYGFAIDQGAGATVAITNNAINEITGAVPFKVYQGGSALLGGQVDGRWDATTGQINGEGNVSLLRDQEYGPITLKQGSNGVGNVSDSKLKAFEGLVIATLSDADGELVALSAQGSFDAENNKIVRVEGTADLIRPIEPIPGIEIHELSGTGVIEDNEIRQVEGTGQIGIPSINLDGTFEAGWRKDGDKDVYWGTAETGLDMRKDMGAPGRGLESVGVGGELREDGSFDLDGDVKYSITDKIGGDIAIAMNQDLDPVLAGTIEAEGTLVDGRELFKWEKDLLNKQIMAGPIPIGFGVRGGLGMSLKPLTFATSFGVSDFHIMEMNVPDFQADLALDSGLGFQAKLAPYLGVGANLGDAFTAMAGLEGQASVDVDVGVGVDGSLRGEGGEFSGEMGIGASITPSATLGLQPFVDFKLLGMGPGKQNFGPQFSHTFDDLFTAEWGKTYTFGDRQEVSDGSTAPAVESAPASATAQFPASGTEAPSLGMGNQTAGREGPEGGPQIGGEDVDSGDTMMDGPFGQFDEHMAKVDAVANGVEGITHILDLVGGNPVSALVELVTNFDGVKASVEKVITALGVAGELLSGLLPGWWEELKGMVERGVDFIADAAGMVWDGIKWAAEGLWDAITFWD